MTVTRIRGANADYEGHLVHFWCAPEHWPGERPIDAFMSPQDAVSLGLRLIESATRALEASIKDIERGDCQRCSNVRMVDEPTPSGGTHSIHCPDCATEPQPIPGLRAWAEREAEILGRPLGGAS